MMIIIQPVNTTQRNHNDNKALNNFLTHKIQYKSIVTHKKTLILKNICHISNNKTSSHRTEPTRRLMLTANHQVPHNSLSSTFHYLIFNPH